MQPRKSPIQNVALALILFAGCGAFGGQVLNLAWNASTDTNVVGYYLYYGPSLGNYTNRIDTGSNLSISTPALPDGPYYFTATARTVQGIESDFANVVTTNIITPPVIDSQPPSLTVSAGSNVVISVHSPNGFLSYYWFRNGTNLLNGGNVNGATTGNLILANAAVSDTATYSVIVSNSAGIAQSSNATLTVYVKPTIQQGPVSATIYVGLTDTLSVTATGDVPISYQWQKDGTDIAGATTSSYTVANARTTDTGSYRCVLRNRAPDITTSAAAQLSVLPDTIPPVVKTTWPTTNSILLNAKNCTNGTLITTAPDIPFSGLVTDNGVITNITITRTTPTWASGPITFTPSGPASSKSWTNVVTLVDGTNTFSIAATDSAGLTTTLLRTIFLRTTNRLTVATNGYGSTTPAGVLTFGSARNGAWLDIGRIYWIRAVPKTGNWFVNWTDGSGTVITTNLTLKFYMTNNLSLTANFVTNGILANHLNGTYNGLFAEDSGVRTASAGSFMSVVLSSTRTFSGRVSVAGSSYGTSGSFDPLGNATKTVVRLGKMPLTLSLHLDFTHGTKQITGTVSCVAENWSSPLVANLSVYNAVNKSPTAARYTMAIPPLPSSDTNSPVGYGYGLITNSPTGLVIMTGALADMTTLSCSAPIAQSGDWPVNVSLYSHAGLLHGWVNLSNSIPTGHLSWIKPSIVQVPTLVNKMYPAGVDDIVDVFGSIYRTATPTIALSSGALELDGSATNSSTYAIAVTNNNVLVSPSHISGTVSTSTGLITLSLPSTVAGGIARTAYGIVLQSSNSAVGTVSGTNAAIYLH